MNYQCTVCSQSFTAPTELANHLIDSHATPAQQAGSEVDSYNSLTGQGAGEDPHSYNPLTGQGRY